MHWCNLAMWRVEFKQLPFLHWSSHLNRIVSCRYKIINVYATSVSRRLATRPWERCWDLSFLPVAQLVIVHNGANIVTTRNVLVSIWLWPVFIFDGILLTIPLGIFIDIFLNITVEMWISDVTMYVSVRKNEPLARGCWTLVAPARCSVFY